VRELPLYAMEKLTAFNIRNSVNSANDVNNVNNRV